MNYPAAGHQRVLRLLWLHVWEAFMSSILIHTGVLRVQSGDQSICLSERKQLSMFQTTSLIMNAENLSHCHEYVHARIVSHF